ncbi:hypothetical protein HZS55_13735 [Halosimplex rubrum]|uniref:DUF4013 domain-containing protein n=1 Tax=Halosimplex rubrum TaxID=869889 RepID=A0A7D5P0Y2_9EURY|nr:hypothetical protein [Halosimplex rubrum]QLH78303.1 hypothetical protein HZS55_13735 [Halosimplex rubrum]
MTESGPERFGRTLRTTARFVYRNGPQLVGLSVLWSLAVLPVVTLGPATLGFYAAVGSLDSDRNRVELRSALGTVRRRLVPAVAFGLAPLLFFALSASYLYAFLGSQSTFQFAAALATFYVGLYLGLVNVPAFVALSRGASAKTAIESGIGWTAANPTLTMLVGLCTLAILVVTLALTIAVVLVFPAAAFSFQVKAVGDDVTV